MEDEDIVFIADLRKAIQQATCVMVKPRFGTYERSVQITKKEALNMLQSYPDNFTAEDVGVPRLGSWYSNLTRTLYLGH